MAAKQKTSDVRIVIHDWLKSNDRTIGWLSNKTGIPYGTLYDIIKKRDFLLSQDKLESINIAAGVDFMEI